MSDQRPFRFEAWPTDAGRFPAGRIVQLVQSAMDVTHAGRINCLWAYSRWSHPDPDKGWQIDSTPLYDTDLNEARHSLLRDDPVLLPPLWSIVSEYAADAAFMHYRPFNDHGVCGFAWATPHMVGRIITRGGIKGAGFGRRFFELNEHGCPYVLRDVPAKPHTLSIVTWALNAFRGADTRFAAFLTNECRMLDEWMARVLRLRRCD